MADAPPAKRMITRTGSFSGVWWKLGDPAVAAAGDASAVERRLRAIADEEADVNARITRREVGARGVRRKVAFTSFSLEFLAFVHAYWMARRRRMGWHKKLLLPLLAIPALAAIILTAFARIRNMFDVRDQRKLESLGAERKSKIGHFRGSHQNMQKLIERYDPDAAADSAREPLATKLKRTHSRLSFHIGDE